MRISDWSSDVCSSDLKAEREAQAERDRIAREDAARVEEARREAEAKAKREADQAHRTAVKTKAKDALMTCGADEEAARKIVVAILAGEIPAVRQGFCRGLKRTL